MGGTAISEELFARARRVIPGGVNSPVRAFSAVGTTPRFMTDGAGCVIRDADGNAYCDYVMSWGPLIAGHAHPDVLAAARRALERGTTFGAPTAAEVELAEEIRDRYPAAERVRLVNSGTEAGMGAVRVARAATGRDVMVKFAGHYHGHADALLAEAGSGVATFGLPDSPGVTRGAVADTVVLPWNDRAAVESVFAERGEEIALIACEPVAANMGVVPPDPGFLQHLRDLSTRHGALLLFDEVMTGFRVARGGAAERYGVTPDLVMLAKVVGGGFPLAAFGGRADVMERLAPVGAVYQAGTLSGNPVAVAAASAQLRLLDAGAYDRLGSLGDQLVAGLSAAFASAGVPAVVQRAASLFSVFFGPGRRGEGGAEGEGAVRDYAGARACDHDRYAAFFNGMLERGHYFPPSGYEAIFVSLAHTPADIDRTVAAAAEVADGL